MTLVLYPIITVELGSDRIKCLFHFVSGTSTLLNELLIECHYSVQIDEGEGEEGEGGTCVIE